MKNASTFFIKNIFPKRKFLKILLFEKTLMSKHAVVGLTKTAALENAHHSIRVNAVCPGGVNTPMMADVISDPGRAERIARGPMGRLAEPQEIADAVAWLASDRSSFVTGVPLPVDGGIMAN